MNAVVVRLEVFSNRIHQLHVRRLDSPWLRRRILGIDTFQIKRVVRLDEAHYHELAPDQVGSSPGELNVAGKNAGQRLARILTGFRFFSRQNE